MYDLIPFFLGGGIVITGIIMIIYPKASTKKEYRNDANAVAKTKKNGFIEISAGIGLIIIEILRLKH